MKSCTWVEDEGFKFWLPNCMGGAVYGSVGCTCERGGISMDEALENAKFYEKQNRKLRTRIAELEKIADENEKTIHKSKT